MIKIRVIYYKLVYIQSALSPRGGSRPTPSSREEAYPGCGNIKRADDNDDELVFINLQNYEKSIVTIQI